MSTNTLKVVPKTFFHPINSLFTEEDLRETFRKSVRGQKIHYHTGFMAIEAEADTKLAALRKIVSDWAAMGMVSLVQRKVAPYSYEYYAVVR